MITFNHFNFNVLDLDKSLAFYRDALDLKVVRENHKEAFSLVFLGDGVTGFSLELTYLKEMCIRDRLHLPSRAYHHRKVLAEPGRKLPPHHGGGYRVGQVQLGQGLWPMDRGSRPVRLRYG